MRILFFSLFLLSFSFAEFKVQNTIITIDWLKKQPRSLYKDFYIWRYLGQNISQNEAIEAMGQVQNVNNKILFRFIDNLNDKESNEIKDCMQMGIKNLLKQDKACIDLGFSVGKATRLGVKELDKLQDIYKDDKDSSIYQTLEMLNAPLPFTKIIASTKDNFFRVFNGCGLSYKISNLNYKLPKSFINRISSDSRFYLTVKLITTAKALDNLQSSLFDVDTTNTDFKSTFMLGVNALNHNKRTTAFKYFKAAKEKAYFRFDIDNSLFWLYQISQDRIYLVELAESWGTNLYSLYAKEKLNKKITNIVYNINQTGKKSPYDYTSPFEWSYVLNMIEDGISDEEMDKFIYVFSDKNTLPHLAFVKAKYDEFKKSYFITPYEKYLENKTLHRKALTYALAKQESIFIPTTISTSYAMGVMQIMPFLSLSLAKEFNEPYDIDKQLDVETNLRYADKHLDFLEYRFKHPLFVAYAYNGGSGFARRMLETGLFAKKGEFEPFLSMELVDYDESKQYGKKVLANYFVYKNHFLDDRKKITLQSLINALKVK